MPLRRGRPPKQEPKGICGEECTQCKKYNISPAGTCDKEKGHGYSHHCTKGHAF